jgi:hypothetical protein
MFDQPQSFQPVNNENNGCIGKNKFSPADFFIRQCVDHGNSQQNEQVGHFLDGNGVGTISQDAEYGKEPEGEPDLQFHIFKQEADQKYEDADQQEAEQVILPSGNRVIQVPYYEYHHEQVKKKPEEQFDETGRMDDIQAKYGIILDIKQCVQHDLIY